MCFSLPTVIRLIQGWTIAALAVLTLGCSSNTVLEEPDPLPEIVEEVELEEVWSRSIGDGMDGNFLFLSPAIVGDKVYAVDVEGELYALEAQTGKQVW